jgi:DNA-binding NarL/FixJ family response regulator
MDGISFLGNPNVKNLQIPKLILTSYNAESKIFDALKHGATGYMFKDDIYSLGQILEILLSGGAYISPTIAVIVANYFKSESILHENQKELTEREEEILKEISSGFSPAEIAEKLSLSIATIRSHIRNIYKKLEVNNQIQLLKKTNEIHN